MPEFIPFSSTERRVDTVAMTLDATVLEEMERFDTNQHVPRTKAMDLLFRTVEMAPLAVIDDKTEKLEIRETRTLLGMPPIAAATRVTAKMEPIAVARRTRPLAMLPRPPARVRITLVLRAMSTDERFWYLAALCAGVLVAAIVLASAYLAGV